MTADSYAYSCSEEGTGFIEGEKRREGNEGMDEDE